MTGTRGYTSFSLSAVDVNACVDLESPNLNGMREECQRTAAYHQQSLLTAE